MKKIRFTRLALADIDSLYDFIAQDNPTAAQEVFDHIESMIDHLPVHPELGHKGRIAATRELIVPDTAYIVAYQIQPDHIDILSIIHSSRKWPDQL